MQTRDFPLEGPVSEKALQTQIIMAKKSALKPNAAS